MQARTFGRITIQYIEVLSLRDRSLVKMLEVSRTLGSNSKTRLMLFFFFFLPHVARRLHLFRRRHIKAFHIQFHGERRLLWLGNSRGDLGVAHTIFVKEEYESSPGHDNLTTIFDVGANIGLSAVYFKIAHPHASVHCFEPDPENFELLKANTPGFSDVYLHQLAVGGSEGVRELYRSRESPLSHSLVRRTDSDVPISVRCVTLREAMKIARVPSIDLLKFDIEGAEDELFADDGGVDLADHLIGEVHLDLLGETRGHALLRRLKNQYELQTSGSGSRILIQGSRKGTGSASAFRSGGSVYR